MNKEDLERYFYLAQVTEQAELYDRTLSHMTAIAAYKDTELNAEERAIFSSAMKHCIGTKRTILRNSMKDVYSKGMSANKVRISEELNYKTYTEFRELSTEIIGIIDELVLPRCTSDLAQVFWLKLKGDYYRYQCEFSQQQDKESNVSFAMESYEMASEIAQSLNKADPVRLGLALNFSVFYYEILDMPDRAVDIGAAALEDGISELDKIDDNLYKEASASLNLLKENIEMWSSDLENYVQPEDAL